MSLKSQRAQLAIRALTFPIVLVATSCLAQTTLEPRSMKQIAQVDPRYLSFNVEAVEVTGGRFWKPYKAEGLPKGEHASSKADSNQPSGMDGSLFQYRPPIDLSNPRLRNLASALAPSYLRVSGTWRNSTYFQDDDAPLLSKAPDGFKGVMNRAEWKGVIEFSHAVGADIVASVATSQGTRDSNNVWTPDQAHAFFEYTKSAGGKIAAVEFMNEPTFAIIGGAPSGYNGAAFGRDAKIFQNFLKQESPDTVFLGPGSIGEGAPLVEGAPMPKILPTEDMLKSSGPIFDAFSYHFYGTISKRCTAAMGPNVGMTPDKALNADWFDRNLTVEGFYAGLRDKYLPGKSMWLTETGEAGCGGDLWASRFLDSFRFMDQLGSLAQKNVQSVMVNTLASSDYGLIDEETLKPRPNYWAALLWKRTMGVRVLDPGVASNAKLRIYAHCSTDLKGGVTVLVLNLDRTASQTLTFPTSGKRFTLSASDLTSENVSLNGKELESKSDGTPPAMVGQPFKLGTEEFAPLTITFLNLPGARNAACTN